MKTYREKYTKFNQWMQLRDLRRGQELDQEMIALCSGNYWSSKKSVRNEDWFHF